MALTARTLVEKIVSTERELSALYSYTGDGANPRSIDVADSATNLEIAFVLDVSEIKAIYIVATQDLTLKTNSSSVPAETIELKAGKPYLWHEDSYFVNLLETDITKLFVTNASGVAAVLDIEVIFDATP
jgi:hypothetical protein